MLTVPLPHYQFLHLSHLKSINCQLKNQDQMNSRINSGYTTFIHEFTKEVLVVCPTCEGRAMVSTNGWKYPDRESGSIRLICTSCGYNKTLERNPTVMVTGRPKKSTSGKHMIFGAPVDPFFHIPLWLQDHVQGNLLWAYNHDHLNFLKNFVEARLRERNGKKLTNGSIGSRLPTWMTSRNNRAVVLKAMEGLLLK